MKTIKQIEKAVGLKLRESSPYYMYGKSLYSDNNTLTIDFGIWESMGGFYAVCKAQYKGESISKKSMSGFGHRTIGDAKKHLSAVKQEVFNKILEIA